MDTILSLARPLRQAAPLGGLRWDELGDLSAIASRDALQQLMSDTLVAAIQASYDRLPEDLQAEIPLKRICTLVAE